MGYWAITGAVNCRFTPAVAAALFFASAFPGAHIHPGASALVGMGVTFGVGARALLTGVVFAAEVTGGYGLVVPLLLAAVFAELAAEAGLRERVMTDKLFRRGYRVDFDAQTDPLRTRVAGRGGASGSQLAGRARGSHGERPAPGRPWTGGSGSTRVVGGLVP